VPTSCAPREVTGQLDPASQDADLRLPTGCLQAVPQADVMQPPLLSPIYSFWSPIPTRTRTMTAQLQGNQILPFPGYQKDASLGAIKKSLANVATYVALDGVAPSTQGK